MGKHVLGVIAILTLVLGSTLTASAQVGELRGKVWMQQADGQKVPLADAQIDVFRTDVKGEYKTKTDKRGEFVFAGLPFIGEYTIAASHATASPNFVPKVKVGRGVPVEITVTPGAGKRLTVEETKTAAASAPSTGGGGNSGGGGGESAADKAKREELMKKNAEIDAANKKITDANEVIARTFKVGNEALAAAGVAAKAGSRDLAIQKYTEALTQFDEGLAADSDQPALLTNKAVALKARGVERYNAAVKSTDTATQPAQIQAAKADFKDAAEASSKAVTLIKAQTAPTDPAELKRLEGNRYAAFITNAEAMRLFVSKGDGGPQAEAGLAAYKDYIAVETDPVKKAKAQLDSAQMLLDAGQSDKAFVEFQTLVTGSPDNPDANLGAGLSLYATGNEAKYQEAANYLQHFVDVAPDSHQMKAPAKEILAVLKEAKITPEKTQPKPRKRP